MSNINYKLIPKFSDDSANSPAQNLTAQITGNVENAFLEIKIPLESSEYDTNASSEYRSASLSGINILKKEVFFEPVVEPSGGQHETTSNVRVSIMLIIESKKPWEGGLAP